MRNLNKKDIEFLNSLQHELNTQDHVSQADPRFWVVRGTVKEFGIEDGYNDGTIITDEDNEITLETPDEIAEYCIEHFYEIHENPDDFIKSEQENIYPRLVFDKENSTLDYFEIPDNVIYLDLNDTYEIVNFCEDKLNLDLRICNYRNVEKNFENTMFLTNHQCKEHIEKNYYHYPKDAHSYAMTAWRSPQVENLWKILQECDFSKITTEEV